MNTPDITVGIWLSSSTTLCIWHVMKNFTHFSDCAFIFGGIYFADMFSGLLHIFLDHKKPTESAGPISQIAQSFQEHHVHPQRFIQRKPWFNPGGQLEILKYLTTPIYITTTILNTLYPNNTQIFVFMYTFLGVATFSQILHGFSHAHRAKVPQLITFLQNHRVIISRTDHHTHHVKGHRNFSLVNGWANPLLNTLYDYILRPALQLLPEHFYP